MVLEIFLVHFLKFYPDNVAEQVQVVRTYLSEKELWVYEISEKWQKYL